MSYTNPNIKDPTDRDRYYQYVYYNGTKPFGVPKDVWDNFIKMMQTQEQERQ